MEDHLQKAKSSRVLSIVVLSWMLTYPGMAAEKFNTTLIGREGPGAAGLPNDLFSHISSVDADDAGNIYILDSSESTVKVFDAKGTFLRRLFRQGEGPGEISHPFMVKWNSFRKTLFIADQYGRSFKEFSPEGKELKKYPLIEQAAGSMTFTEADSFVIFNESKDGKTYRIIPYDFTSNRFSREIATDVPVKQKMGFPGHVIDNGKIWFCPEDRMQLISYSLKDGRRIDNISIPEEYRPFSEFKSAYVRIFVTFQQGIPIMLDGELHLLVFRKSYSGDSFRTPADCEAETTSVQLYRFRSGRLEKRADLGSHEGVVDFGFARDRRLALFHNSPFPQVRILDLR